MKKIINGIKILLIVTPLFLGTVGYYIAFGTGSFLDSLYAAVRLYGLNTDVAFADVNLMIEISRWCAVFAVYTVIGTVLLRITNLAMSYKTLFSNCVGLHGDSELLSEVKKTKGYRFVEGGKAAKRQLFWFNKEDDLQHYLVENWDLLEKKNTQNYICSHFFDENSNFFGNAVIVNLANICARLYWEKYFLREREKDIVIIGFGKYGEHLLRQALLVNVLNKDVHVVYHVFVLSQEEKQALEEFVDLHRGMEKFISIVGSNKEYNGDLLQQDVLYLHQEGYAKAAALIEKADRVIVTSDNDMVNLETMYKIKEMVPRERIDMRFLNDALLTKMWEKEGDLYCMNPNVNLKHGEKRQYIALFGSTNELTSLDTIFHDKLTYIAKLIHARWKLVISQHYDDLDTSLEEIVRSSDFQTEWNNLAPFYQYSNILQADHISHKVRFVLGEDVDVNSRNVGTDFKNEYASLSEQKKDELSELEHIRWLRYYYFNNWEYDPVRNDFNRRHQDIQSFSKLDKGEKDKDEVTYEIKAYLDIRNAH